MVDLYIYLYMKNDIIHNIYIDLSIMISSQCLDMGKRKLRFVQGKNYEHKRGHVSVTISPVQSTPQQMVVSFPLSAYKLLVAGNSTTLFSRLRRISSLPVGWIMMDSSEVMSSSRPHILCKMELHPPNIVPSLLFTITFNNDCTWQLMVCERLVNLESCSLLSTISSIQSVDAVTELFSMLNCSKFCEGNRETNFMELASSNRGVFMNQGGKLVVVVSV